MRHPLPVVLCVGLALATGLSVSVPRQAFAEVKAGDLRAVQSKEGIPLKEEPRAMAKTLKTVPYGTKVKVLEIRELYARVAIEGLGEGWARSALLVEPGTLTGRAAYAGAVTSADVTAAGRQFDAKTENTYRSMNEDIAKYYPKVDEVETVEPTALEVDTFIRAGELGGTAGDPTGNSGSKYAKLSLISTNGLKESDGSFDDLYVPQPRAMNDADFVQRLGMGFSPEQEYFLGRSVAAAAIAEYGLDPDASRQALVKRIGASIVTLADRVRGTYGGYHFAVLDSDVPNGVSGPGGFVLITRGALRYARNEDEVAGVVAHEIAHVVHKHGEQTIRKSRDFQEKLKALQEKVSKPPERPGDCNICGDMARMLGGTAKTFVQTLIKESYEKDFELEADWDGSLYLCEVGYRASAIAEYLEVLPAREGATWTTHPSPEDRVENLRPIVFKHGCPFDSDTGALARLPRYRALGFGAPAGVPVGDRLPASAGGTPPAPAAPAAPAPVPAPGAPAPTAPK